MNVMGIIFTNDASLGELTDKRTMASLPFGGRYRQVDFALQLELRRRAPCGCYFPAQLPVPDEPHR